MLRCLIIDDEPLARQVMENYIRRTPGLAHAGSCSNAIEGYKFLERQAADILYLDIRMPLIDGLTFLRSLKSPPAVVFTTAFSTHAVESYELNAIDYLVKPFSYERFCQSLEKVRKQTPEPSIPVEKTYLFIKKDNLLQKVFFNEIIFMEARKDYLKIYTPSKEYITHMTMKYIQSILPASFIRIHRSYIIAKDKVTRISRTSIEISGNHQFPIGESYREAVQKNFNNEV